MVALYRSGRQADALDVYRQTSETLAEELGLDPGRELQRLQAAILRQEPGLDAPREASAGVGTPGAGGSDATSVEPDVRKTVTVLVARRKSARGIDPEALSREDDRFRAHLGRMVGRYGGVIASAVGDEAMAVFGVPRAHEDDAFRASCAALEIRDAPVEDGTSPFPIPHVGIATGEVLASDTGASPLSVVGDPVSAAGELLGLAGAGEILLGEVTERLIREQADLEPVHWGGNPRMATG